jgi:hypothetical protein
VTDGGNAAAGVVGEYVIVTSTAINIANNTVTALTGATLLAGDWEVGGSVICQGGSATVPTVVGGCSQSSTALPAAPFYAQHGVSGSGNAVAFAVPTQRFSSASSIPFYFDALVVWSGTGPVQVTGSMWARRVR